MSALNQNQIANNCIEQKGTEKLPLTAERPTIQLTLPSKMREIVTDYNFRSGNF